MLVAVASAATLWDIVNTRPELSTMRKFIKQRNLQSRFNEPGQFTVFVPSNSAFSSQPQANINYMNNPANEVDMKLIIEYHIIKGGYTANNLLDAGTGTSYNGLTLNFYDDGTNGYVEQAKFIKTDIKADNGYMHIIDHVLYAPGNSLPDTSSRRRRLLGLNHADQEGGAAAEIETDGEINSDVDA